MGSSDELNVGSKIVWSSQADSKFVHLLYAYWCDTKDITKIPKAMWDGWVTEMAPLFSGPLVRRQLQSRKTRMKEMWATWKALKSKTGLGWDDEKNCVVGDAHTWQQFVNVSLAILLSLWLTIVLENKFKFVFCVSLV